MSNTGLRERGVSKITVIEKEEDKEERRRNNGVERGVG